MRGAGGGGGGRRAGRRAGRRRRRAPCRAQLQRGDPGGGGTQPGLGGTGFHGGPGPATSPLGAWDMRVSVGGAGAEGRRWRQRRPGPQPRCRSGWAPPAECRRRARPEPPSLAAAPRNGGRAGALGGGGERAGPALSHPGRLGPGRAAAPDADAGWPGPDYALGKSPIHRARGGGLVAPTSFPAGVGPASGPPAARACAPRLPSCGDRRGAPGSCPFSLAPSGSLGPERRFPPGPVSLSKYGAGAREEPRSRAPGLPVPSPRLLGSPPALLRPCRSLFLGNSGPFAPRPWRRGPGSAQAGECGDGLLGAPGVRPARLAGPRRARRPAPSGSARRPRRYPGRGPLRGAGSPPGQCCDVDEVVIEGLSEKCIVNIPETHL